MFQALLLGMMITLGVVMALSLALFGRVALTPAGLGPNLAILLSLGGALVLLRRGYWSAAVWVVISAILLGLARGLWQTGLSQSDHLLITFAIPITLAGLLAGRRSLILTVALSLIIVSSAAVVEQLQSGMAPLRAEVNIASIYFVLISLLLAFLLDRFGITLREAQGERARAEQAQRASEARYHSLAEAAHDMIFIINRAGQVNYVNSIAAQAFGRPAEAIIGQPAANLFPPRVLAHQRANVQRVLETREPIYAETLTPLGNHDVWLSTWLSPLANEGGEINAVLGVSRDITARKEAEDALLASEERYRLLAETTSDYAFVDRVEPDGSIVPEWVTEAFTRITGYALAETSGADFWLKLVHPADHALFLQHTARVIAGQPDAVEARILTKTGEVRWLRDVVHPVWDPAQGRVIRLYGGAQDITERKQAEESLRQSEERFNAFMNNSPATAFIKDEQGRLVYINPAFERAFDFHNRNWQGKTDFELWPAATAQMLRASDARILASGQPEAVEESVEHADGRHHWLTFKFPFRDQAGRVYLAGMGLDLTERKQAEQALRESQARLKLLNSIAIGMTSGRPVEEIIERTVRYLGNYFPTVRAAYGTLSAEGHLTVVRAVAPPQMTSLAGLTLDLSVAPVYLATLRRGELVIIEELLRDARLAPLAKALAPSGTQALMVVPLTHARQLLGLLLFDSPAPRVWSDQELTTLTEAADYLAVAVQDAQARQERQQALLEMREAETKYRALVEEVPAITYAVAARDVSGGILYVSPQVERILGFTPAEWLAGEPGLWGRRLHPEDRAGALSAWERHRTLGEPFSAEYRMLAEDGREVWLHDEARWVLDERGQRRFTQGLMLDVTQQKRAEADLRASEARFKAVFESAAIGIALTDLEGRSIESNKTLQALHGYNAAELRQMTFAEFTHPADVAADTALFRELMAGERDHYQLEKRYLHKNGHILWGHLTVSLVRDTMGQPQFALAMVEDITERKRAAQRQEAVYRIAQASDNAADLDELFRAVHEIVSTVMPAHNFYIALYDPQADWLSFPYFVDEADEVDSPRKSRRGLTEYILRTGQPLLCTLAVQTELEQRGEVELVGVQSPIWLGVPLVAEKQTIGVMVVQHYSDAQAYGEREQQMLEFVSSEIARAINRKRAETALRLSEARYRSLVETQSELIARSDLRGYLTFVNDSYCRTLGQRREVLLGQVFMPDVVPEDVPVVAAALRAIQKPPHRQQIETRQLTPEGMRWFSWDNAAILDEAGRVMELQGVGRDITERKQAEAQLARQVQESQALGRISEMLAISLDLPTVLQQIVDSAASLIGRADRAVMHLLDKTETVLQPVAVAGHETQSLNQRMNFQWGRGIAGLVIASGETIILPDAPADQRYISMEGQVSHVRSLLVAPVFVGERRLGTLSLHSAALGVFTDDDAHLLTTLGAQAGLAIQNARLFEVERRRAEEAEALQQVTRTLITRRNLPELLQTVVEAIATIADYKYIAVNLREETRLVPQAYTGYPAEALQPVEVETGFMGHIARTGLPVLIADVTQEVNYVPGMPNVRSFAGVPLLHSGQVLGVLSVEAEADRPLDENDLNWLMNIGSQLGAAIKNAELYADLEKALKYEQSARAHLVQTEKLAGMGRLVASVAHELNNPLQAIQNALYLVKQESTLTEQSREDLQVALGEADRMAELISRLRETYRPATSAEFHPESLNELVRQIEKLIGTHLRHNNVVWEFNPEASLPLVMGLRDQLKQALLNLSLNAVEAMPTGGQLTIATRSDPESHGLWLLIADTGQGIEPEALPNIFDPFFTTKTTGTGLGLAITHDIVQRHGGRIEVESAAGQGTTFKVWLPAQA